MLRIQEPEIIAGITIPNVIFKLLAGIASLLCIFFSVSLAKIDLMEKYEKLFVTPPANTIKRACWFTYLIVFYMAVILNFVDGLTHNVTNLGQSIKTFAFLGGFVWIVYIVAIMISHSVKGNWKKKISSILENVSATLKIRKALDFILRIKCLIELSKPKQRDQADSPIVRYTDNLLNYLKFVSPLNWYTCFFKKKLGSAIVEKYVAFCFVLELLVFTTLFFRSLYEGREYLACFISILALVRLVDMFQASLNAIIFNPIRETNGDIHYGIKNELRSLTLILLNYAELVVIFGIISFLSRDAFVQTYNSTSEAFISPLDSLRYSLNVATLQGTLISPANVKGNIIFLGQVFWAITYIFLILGRVITLLPNLRTRDKTGRS
jgi:hypothetical protein